MSLEEQLRFEQLTNAKVMICEDCGEEVLSPNIPYHLASNGCKNSFTRTNRWHKPTCPVCVKPIYSKKKAVHVDNAWHHIWCRIQNDDYARSKY